MSSHPRAWNDGYEVVHVWPKAAETDSFISHQRQPSSGNGITHTFYEGHNVTGTGSAGAATPSRVRSRCFGLGWWTLEILALVLSIASLIAIVIVLHIYNGRPVLDLGLPTGLTLNAIVAALATVSRAALMVPVASSLMQELWLFFAKEAKKTTCSSRLSHLDIFDSASRGTWGSAMLLARLHGRRIFASLAALITILSLAFGTFVQQAITYDRLVDLPSNSSLTPRNIPRTETWTEEYGRPSEGYMSPGLEFIAALYDGALRGGIAPPALTCRSGNCTWPLTPSLAICGGCVSSKPIKVICHQSNETIIYPFCDYTLPSGSVMQLANFEQDQDPDGGAGFRVAPSSGAHYDVSAGDRAYFANFDLMGLPYGLFGDGLASDNNMKAAECALWMCVQTYNTSVTSGEQKQTVVSQIDNLNVRNLAYTGWFPGMEFNATFPPLPITEDPERSTKFIVDAEALYALRWYFNATMRGNITFSQETAKPSSDMIFGVWNGTTDLDAWIANVAKSVTGVLRTNGTVTWPQYDGTAQGMGVHIRWLWLLLPLVLIALSVLVLVAAIVRTAISPVEAWKGSPLTFLLFGVDEQIKDAAYGRGINHDGFQQAVGGKTVRLAEESGTFWKFKPS